MVIAFIFYATLAVIGGGMLAWLHTKSGKKWLKSL